MKKLALLAILGTSALAGCVAQDVDIKKPNGETVKVQAYPGSQHADALMIINGDNHFGTIGFDQQDPLTDLSWRGNDGTKINAECTESGKALYSDQIEC